MTAKMRSCPDDRKVLQANGLPLPNCLIANAGSTMSPTHTATGASVKAPLTIPSGCQGNDLF